MKIICHTLFSLLLIGLCWPAFATVNAWIDRNEIQFGESVQFTLQHDGQTGSQPDLEPLKKDFDIIRTSSESSFQMSDGKTSAQIQLHLTIVPKHDGKLQVPSILWDNQSSPMLELTVIGKREEKELRNAPTGNSSHGFITVKLGDVQPYIRSATVVTARLYVDVPLYQASLEFKSNKDLLIEQLGEDRQTSETYNKHNYLVIERKYVLSPQRSGRIRIDGPELIAQIQDSRTNEPNGFNPNFGNIFGQDLFGRGMQPTKPLRIQGEPVILNVRPSPARGKDHEWLPAQSITLEETWLPENGMGNVAKPITRHLQISAQGLSASQLPDISLLMTVPAGLRAISGQARLSNRIQGEGVIGLREQEIALIASSPGRYEIPALHLYWWDTAKNMQREIILPARTLEFLPNTPAITAMN